MIITRYLAKEVYVTLLATVIVLLFIFLSNQFVHYMQYVAVGNITLHDLSLLLLLHFPLLLAMLLPLSLYLSILVAYGRLYADSEMTVLAACGMRPLALMRATIGFSIVITIIVGLLSLWINPYIYSYTDQIASGSTSSALELLVPNRFNPLGKGKWVFYVNGQSHDKKLLSDVFAAERPDGFEISAENGLNVVAAKSAYQKLDRKTGDLYLVLTDGYRYIGTPGKNNYQIIKYDQYGAKVKQNANSWRPDESTTPTIKLWQQRKQLINIGELQWRISMPMSVLILALLGTPLSRVKPRRGRYAQLVPAFLLYIIYTNFLFMTKAWVQKGALVPMIGMWWVHVLMLGLAAVLFWYQLAQVNFWVCTKKRFWKFFGRNQT